MITIFLVTMTGNSLRCGIRASGGGITGAFFETVTISHEENLIHVNRELSGFYLIIEQYKIVNLTVVFL